VFRTHRGFVLFALAVAGMLQFLIIRGITGADTASIVPALLSHLPERFQLMINETLISRLSAEGAAAFGFNHPIVMVLLAISSVSVAARHVSGDIEDGVMEITLAHPIGRVRLLASVLAAGAAMNLVIVAGAVAGSFFALVVFHAIETTSADRLLVIAGNLWMVSLVMLTGAVAAAAFAAKGTRPGLWTASVLLGFYVLHFLTPLWDPLRVFVPVNVFSYYQPQKLILAETSAAKNFLVLVVAAGVLFGLAARRFSARDIPG
jgi:ABC-2 type transport system permease protein